MTFPVPFLRRPLRRWSALLLLPVLIVRAAAQEPEAEMISPALAQNPAPSSGNATDAAPAATWSALPRADKPAPAASTKPTPTPPVTNHQSPVTAAPPTSDAELAASTGEDMLPPGVAAVGAEPGAMPPSQNVTINLINRLVKRGVLTKEDAAELIQQAEADAQVAQAQAAATQEAVAQANSAAQQAVANTPPPPEDDGSVRVTYVPEIVKSQISTQVKDEVMAQAKSEGWAAPNLIPGWLAHIHPFADIRVRYEGDFFPDGNDNTGAFPNFNAINTGAPFNVAGDQFSPQLNVDQDRTRYRLRARFGADLDLGDGFSAGVRLATGENNSPTSTNQSMGLPTNGQGGNFSKYAIWLDRAFIKYELGGLPSKNLALTVGRFDNPFFTTSEIMWDSDIGFDGLAVQGKYEVLRGFTPFVTGGLFPVYNTDFNFSSNQPQKFPSYDKYLYAIQGGADWKITKDIEFTGAVGYFYFQNIEGKLSTPYTPLTADDAGDTDNSRPAFAQKGNTYMALRDIVPDASNDYGTINQWQYYGLATPFQDLMINGKLQYKHFEPFVASVSFEYVKNLAFDKNAVAAVAVNNRGATDSLSDSLGGFAGGDNAWIVQAQIGSESLSRRWDWNLFGGYRYVESDAVVDGFNDSDFGGGGTNLKGYTVGGSLALSTNVYLTVRYLSATSIAGPPFKEDIIQLDLNAKF